MNRVPGTAKMVAVTMFFLLLGGGLARADGPKTFEFGPGSLTTTDATTGWGGYNSLIYPVEFDGTAGITIEIQGLDLSAIVYTGDMGWPPDSGDTGAFAGFGLDGTGNVRYQVLSNMANGKGIWDDQSGSYINDTSPGYRSYLFQGWAGGSGPSGNHQFNAEQWGNSTHPEYDTVDIRFEYSSGTVSAWVRLHASWSWDDDNRAANWTCPWNPAMNNAATGTANNIWDGTCIDEVSPGTGRVNGAWVAVFDGPWTTSEDLSAVTPYVFIQNWAYANGPYTVAWDNLKVTGVPSPQPEVWVDDDWAGLTNGDNVAGHIFGYDAFATIQEGVDAVADGGTVRVRHGLYQERVVIDKPMTLKGLLYPHIDAPVVSVPTDNEEAVVIQASDVRIRGFIIIQHQDDGVLVDCLSTTDDVVIERNIIQAAAPTGIKTAPGIFACSSNNLTIHHNLILNSTGAGIFLGLAAGGTDVTNSLMKGNFIKKTPFPGILVVRGSGNMITRNIVRFAGTGRSDDGIRLGLAATNNMVKRNVVFRSTRDGIRAVGSASGNTVKRNVSLRNAGYDINDLDSPPSCDNTWIRNVFRTNGGCATD